MERGRTSVVSIVRDRMSGRDRFWTIISSSGPLETINTTNPFLSRSKDSDRVRGRLGDPAITTTSVRPPLRDRFARLVLRSLAFVRYVRYITVPVVNTTTPVIILCLDIQFWMPSNIEVGTARIGAGGGGRGRMDSGTHDAAASASRRVSAIFSTCWSM